MLNTLSLTRMNRIASLAILPLMTLAIVIFARYADDGTSSDEPPRAGTLIVANLRSESLTFFDLRSGDATELLLSGPPHEMVEAEGRLYVTLGRANALMEIDVHSAAILRVLPLDGEPHGLALYGQNIIVTLDKANAAIVLDRASLTELRRYPTGNTPHVVAVSSQSILVTDSRDNLLRQLEPGSATVATGAVPEGIAMAGTYAVTADAQSGTLTIANASDLSNAHTSRVGDLPVRVVNYDDERVLVALQGQGEVAVVNAASGKVERRIQTAARPDGICPSPDRAYFAVDSNAEGVVQVFSTEDWKRVAQYTLASGLGACIWLEAR